MKSDEDKIPNKPQSNQQAASPTLLNDVTQTAMGVMALLKNDKKRALQQVKQLSKLNKDLAYAVLTADVDGWTPLHACALRGSKKLLKAMLQVGIPINYKMGQPEGLPGRCTLLHVAANRPDKKILDYLLHHGADVNARDSDGNTALFYARQANKDSARLLLSCGATEGDSHPDNHTEAQQHHLVSANSRRRLGSSSSLRKEHSPRGSSTDTWHQLQHDKQRHAQKVSPRRSPLLTASSASSSEVKAASAKSHFLTVPPTKMFSSSPCLHQSTSAAGSTNTFISSNSNSANNFISCNSSTDLTCSSHGTHSKSAQSKGSVNNNNTTITDRNKRELKGGSRSVNASTESLRKQLDFNTSQNNSD